MLFLTRKHDPHHRLGRDGWFAHNYYVGKDNNWRIRVLLDKYGAMFYVSDWRQIISDFWFENHGVRLQKRAVLC